MRICLFEDAGHARLEPASLTRPVFDLLCGLDSLAAKQCRYFAPCSLGLLVRPALADLTRGERPGFPVNDLDWLRSEPTILVNGRWLPPAGLLSELPTPSVGLVGDEVAWAWLDPDQLTYVSPATLDDCLRVWQSRLPRQHAGGRMMAHLWDLVEHNGAAIARDFAQVCGRRPPAPPADLCIVGPAERVLVDPTARIDPLVVIDASAGPVVIEREAVIASFSRLEGPCCIGPETQVLGARIRGGTTLGPGCRIGGEVEASIIQGHTNKYHEGFLGHAYLGEWINLGAGSQCSDLRNDYGPISVPVAGELTDTGLRKVGCFIGDHAKIGLGTLLNTGSSIGAFCNVLPGAGYAPRWLPSFTTWWKDSICENGPLASLLRTASEVMRRRGQALTEVRAACCEQLREETAALRQRAIREADQRRLRRSA